MSMWMMCEYAKQKVKLGEWTQDEADKFIADMELIELGQYKFDERMNEYWRELKESSTIQN